MNSVASFQDLVAEAGGQVLGDYIRPTRAVLVACHSGHVSEVFPANLLRGARLCRFCKGPRWDAFYVVSGPAGMKFGITHGDARVRLRAHQKDGYTDVLRLRTGLPDGLAHQLETGVKAALREAGHAPVRGREYFTADALGVALPLVDAWLK